MFRGNDTSLTNKVLLNEVNKDILYLEIFIPANYFTILYVRKTISKVASQAVTQDISKCPQYRGVLISGCWNREVPLYTEVSSFQEVGFYCISS